MAWNTPITSNLPASKVTTTTFDEIGENQIYLKERADKVDTDLGQPVNTSNDVVFNKVTTPTGAITTVNSTTINNSGTINGANINTGQGVTEVHLMNQNVRTSDSPTFAGLTSNGSINPTTTPIESTETLTSAGTIIIPRGLLSILITATQSNPSGTGNKSTTVSLQVYRFGIWNTISTFTIDGSQGFPYTGSLFIPTLIPSSGNDTRVIITQQILSGSPSFDIIAGAKIRKY